MSENAGSANVVDPCNQFVGARTEFSGHAARGSLVSQAERSLVLSLPENPVVIEANADIATDVGLRLYAVRGSGARVASHYELNRVRSRSRRRKKKHR